MIVQPQFAPWKPASGAILTDIFFFIFQVSLSSVNEKGDQNFKRKLSKREKKELKKKEKLSRLKSDTNNENRPVAEKLYTGD